MTTTVAQHKQTIVVVTFYISTTFVLYMRTNAALTCLRVLRLFHICGITFKIVLYMRVAHNTIF